ncbi:MULTISPECIES: hypothetical protein [Bacillus cereus group]|uniref:Uncharacterized protein n=1 Tax=Bacillus thuringiensis TaxID=1428 RepID=A0A9X7FY26_BACTU|nr:MULTISPECIES: hypothetical protein [Bacillus cereus group]PEV64175.1 hypothetical protein CN434_25540 [Bacillus thuringiensis]PFT50799.1 hypothetical protein COK72_01990 [Bacillus thuringiensis]PFY22836.1 hypothetical protein COL44_18310 [Bacillus toyonensis]
MKRYLHFIFIAIGVISCLIMMNVGNANLNVADEMKESYYELEFYNEVYKGIARSYSLYGYTMIFSGLLVGALFLALGLILKKLNEIIAFKKMDAQIASQTPQTETASNSQK